MMMSTVFSSFVFSLLLVISRASSTSLPVWGARNAIGDDHPMHLDLHRPQQSVRKLQPPSDVDLLNCNVTNAEFNITIRDMSSIAIDDRYERIFNWAARRWELIIVGDLSDFEGGLVDDWFAGAFQDSFSGPVEDVVIGFALAGIDGVGGTLGRAGGTFFRTRNGVPVSTIAGIMEFDIDDMERMDQTEVRSVVLHEMGHVLGLVGTLGNCAAGCNRESGISMEYGCSRAATTFASLSDERLLLENDGGAGTACGHWEESIFRTAESSELMTGFFEANLLQPISVATVAALEDLGGYEVDYCGADIWPATPDIEQKYEVLLPTRTISADTVPSGAPRTGIDPTGRRSSLDSSWGNKINGMSLVWTISSVTVMFL